MAAVKTAQRRPVAPPDSGGRKTTALEFVRRFGGSLLVLVMGLAMLTGSVGLTWNALTTSPLLGEAGADIGVGAELVAEGIPRGLVEDAGNCLSGDPPVYRVPQVFKDGCEVYPIPSGTAHEARIQVVALQSLGGEWSGEDAQVALELPGETTVSTGRSVGPKSWGTFWEANTERIEPWMDVTLPAIDPGLEGTIVTGEATMEVGMPYISGASTFTVGSNVDTRQLRLYVVSPDQYERLQSSYLEMTWQAALLWTAGAVGLLFPFAVWFLWFAGALAFSGEARAEQDPPKPVQGIMLAGFIVGALAASAALVGMFDICVGDDCHAPPS